MTTTKPLARFRYTIQQAGTDFTAYLDDDGANQVRHAMVYLRPFAISYEVGSEARTAIFSPEAGGLRISAVTLGEAIRTKTGAIKVADLVVGAVDLLPPGEDEEDARDNVHEIDPGGDPAEQSA